mgnify:CR=1 FL=1
MRIKLVYLLPVLLLVLTCSSNVRPKPDIYKTLAGNTQGSWKYEKSYTDTDGSKVRFLVYLVFRLPNVYRWRTSGTRNYKDDPSLSYTEEGTFEVNEEEKTITFTPNEGDPWTVTYEFLQGSDNLKITKSDGEVYEFVWVITYLWS